MKQEIKMLSVMDNEGNPAGGYAKATGIDINFQNGPLGLGDKRVEPNGAFVDTLIEISIRRLHFYQTSKFRSRYNDDAIYHLNAALTILEERTKERERKNIEGTNIVDAPLPKPQEAVKVN